MPSCTFVPKTTQQLTLLLPTHPSTSGLVTSLKRCMQTADLLLAQLLSSESLGVLQSYALLWRGSCLSSFPALYCSFSCCFQNPLLHSQPVHDILTRGQKLCPELVHQRAVMILLNGHKDGRCKPVVTQRNICHVTCICQACHQDMPQWLHHGCAHLWLKSTGWNAVGGQGACHVQCCTLRQMHHVTVPCCACRLQDETRLHMSCVTVM